MFMTQINKSTERHLIQQRTLASLAAPERVPTLVKQTDLCKPVRQFKHIQFGKYVNFSKYHQISLNIINLLAVCVAFSSSYSDVQMFNVPASLDLEVSLIFART